MLTNLWAPTSVDRYCAYFMARPQSRMHIHTHMHAYKHIPRQTKEPEALVSDDRHKHMHTQAHRHTAYTYLHVAHMILMLPQN